MRKGIRNTAIASLAAVELACSGGGGEAPQTPSTPQRVTTTTTAPRFSPIPQGDHAPLQGVKWGGVSGITAEAVCNVSPAFTGYPELASETDKQKWLKAASFTTQVSTLTDARAKEKTPAIIYANPPGSAQVAGMEAAELVMDPSRPETTAQAAFRIGAEDVCLAGIYVTIYDNTFGQRSYEFQDFMGGKIDGPGDVDPVAQTLVDTGTPVS